MLFGAGLLAKRAEVQKRSVKMAPIIQYFSYAVKYYLAVAANSGKLKVVSETRSGCEIIRENYGRFEQIILDTSRSRRAPGN